MKPILVLCLGNEVLTDDAFGPKVAQAAARCEEIMTEAEVEFAAVAGFALLDLLHGREAVLIVDTILTGQVPPGTLHFFPLGYETPSQGLTTSHQISLPTALRFGRLLGYRMPESVDILAVEAADVETLGESLTPSVAAAVPGAVKRIGEWIGLKKRSVSSNGKRDKEKACA